MTNMRSVCFIIAFHKFVTLENRLTYQCPSSWPVVITMKKKSAGTWKKSIGYWPVQLNDNKFATGQILKKPVEVVKGRILASWAQKSPEPCIVVVVVVMEVVTYRPALFLRPHMIDWYMYYVYIMGIRSTVTLTVDHMEVCDDAPHVGNWKANPVRSYFTTLAKARQIEDWYRMGWLVNYVYIKYSLSWNLRSLRQPFETHQPAEHVLKA